MKQALYYSRRLSSWPIRGRGVSATLPATRTSMDLIAILLGTLMAGVGSVWLAAVLSFGVLARYTEHMLSLAAGALLGAAFASLVPEAFATGTSPRVLSATLLAGLIFFFLLEKAELWHHGHEHDPALPTLDEAMAAIRASGGLEYSIGRAREYAALAEAALDGLRDTDAEAVAALRGLVRHAVDRGA